MIALKSTMTLAVAAAMAAGAMTAAVTAQAAPNAGTMVEHASKAGPASNVANVGYRGPGFTYDPGYFSDGDLEPNQGLRHGWLGPQLSGGVLKGQTVIAGAIAERRASKADMRLCEARYRNFDAGTGTYLDRRGQVRVCPFLY